MDRWSYRHRFSHISHTRDISMVVLSVLVQNLSAHWNFKTLTLFSPHLLSISTAKPRGTVLDESDHCFKTFPLRIVKNFVLTLYYYYSDTTVLWFLLFHFTSLLDYDTTVCVTTVVGKNCIWLSFLHTEKIDYLMTLGYSILKLIINCWIYSKRNKTHLYSYVYPHTGDRSKKPCHSQLGKGSNGRCRPSFRCVPLTQDINMAVLNVVDALLDGLVTAHV